MEIIAKSAAPTKSEDDFQLKPIITSDDPATAPAIPSESTFPNKPSPRPTPDTLVLVSRVVIERIIAE
jgi:hypothetical protein